MEATNAKVKIEILEFLISGADLIKVNTGSDTRRRGGDDDRRSVVKDIILIDLGLLFVN